MVELGEQTVRWGSLRCLDSGLTIERVALLAAVLGELLERVEYHDKVRLLIVSLRATVVLCVRLSLSHVAVESPHVDFNDSAAPPRRLVPHPRVESWVAHDGVVVAFALFRGVALCGESGFRLMRTKVER